MANSNAVDLVISVEAQRQVLELTNNLKKTDAEILSISANARALSQTLSGITLPSNLAQLNATNAQLTAQIQAQATALANLQLQYNGLSQNRIRNNQQSAEESVNQRLLNRNARESATITSTLAGAYGRLNAEQSRASRNLQDLVVRGRQAGQTQREYNRELSTAQSEFNQLNQRVISADRAVSRFNRNVGNYPTAIIGGLKDIIGAFGVVGGLSLGVDMVKSIFSVSKEIQSLDLALKQVTETASQFTKTQSFLSKISEDYGVNINDLTSQFTQFYVSAKDKISGKEIENIFESITKAGSTMGLSAESQQRAFLALNQMMSKGTIQAEELRGQLGEALPGALGIMAKAVGVNEVELGKMMKSGELLSSDVLPKFARQLEITYGIENINRVENLSAAQNRLTNLWVEFVRTLNDSDSGGVTQFFSNVMSGVNFLLKGLVDVNRSLKSIRSEFTNDATSSQIEYLNSIKNVSEREAIANITKKDAIKQINLMNESLAQANHQYELFNKVSLKNLMPSAIASRKEAQKDIEKYNASLGTQKGRLLAAQQVLDEINNKNIPKKQEELELSKKLNTVLDKNIQLTTNSEKAISANINAMKEQLSNMDKTSDAYQLLNSLIKLTEASTKMLGQSGEDIFIKPIIEDTSGEIIPPISQNQEDQSAWLKQYKIDQDDFLEKQKEVQNYLKSFSSEFMANSGFSETFDMLNGDIEGFGENFSVTFNAIAESAQEAFNFISNASQQNFDAEKQRIEDQQKIAISYAGGSEVAIAKINEDAEKRKKDIANRENKAKQKQAIFNIAIDTAQAIMATVGKTGFAGLPLALILGALGAAQIAMVASQKIPQYFDGTDNHIGGMMLVNDGAGSNYQEKVILPNGKEIMPEGRNVLMNAPKGTKVLTHEQQIMQMLNERGISMSAKYNQNNGATAQEIDSVMSKHFSKIQTNNTTFDKNGFRSWSEKNGNRTIQNNNRVSRTGFKI